MFQNLKDEYSSRSTAALLGKGHRNSHVLQQLCHRQQCLGASLGSTVPYKRHVINPLSLWASSAWLKERKDLI